MIKVAGDAGADSLTFHNLIFLGKSQIEAQKKADELLGCASREWEGFVSEPGIDSSVLQRTLDRIRRGAYPFAVDVYPNFSRGELKRYYGEADFVPREYPCRCLSPWLTAYVFPGGAVRPCLNSSYSFGNLKEMTFKQIWNSAAARRYRKILRQRGIFPACVRCTELYRY